MIQVRRWIPMHADLAWSMLLRFPVQSRRSRASGLFMQSRSRGASWLFMQSRRSRGFRLFMQSCSSRASRFFMQSRRSRVSGLLLPVRMRFPASAVSRRVRLPSSPASRANVASGRVHLCRNLTDTSFLSVPLRAHLSGDRSITINPLSAVHFWYFPSISGRNREAFYQKYFYGISVLADILGIKPYFHKKNTRNRYQINSSW